MRNPGRSRVAARWACIAVAIGLTGGSQALAADSSRAVRSLVEQRHHNVVLQRFELSCAAAALATVLRYQHGVAVTERSVALGLINRDEYIANPDLVRLRQGFSLLDLKRFVDMLGFEGVGLGKLEFRDLLERAPVIVPVSVRGYPHFVVFRGATADAVLLADPAFGNVTMSIDKFVEGWIDYREIGRVGFVVTKSGALVPPGRLAARPSDFFMSRRSW